MQTDVRLFKLTNGEDIIAQIIENNSNTYSVNNPLLMKVHTRVTNDGIQEGLHLSRWLQPFCEEKNFTIEKTHVLLSQEVSIGLSKYYEYSLKSFERDEKEILLPVANPRTVKELKGPEPTNNELEEILKEEEQEFLDLESPSKVYH